MPWPCHYHQGTRFNSKKIWIMYVKEMTDLFAVCRTCPRHTWPGWWSTCTPGQLRPGGRSSPTFWTRPQGFKLGALDSADLPMRKQMEIMIVKIRKVVQQDILFIKGWCRIKQLRNCVAENLQFPKNLNYLKLKPIHRTTLNNFSLWSLWLTKKSSQFLVHILIVLSKVQKDFFTHRFNK